MKNKTIHGLTVLSVAFAAVTSACSDQGAVKSDARKPAAASSAPAPVAGHDSPQTLPPGHPPVDASTAAAPGLPPVPEGAGTGATALKWTVPPGWVSKPPSNSMRKAEYSVPGKAGDGECVVFYFGPGQGGDPMSNAMRWAEQFTTASGAPVQDQMKTSEVEAGGSKATIVEVAGTYKGGMTMTAAPATPKPNYRLLGAIAPGPDANWYFKLTGPDDTVKAQHDAFIGMVKSLKHGAS